MTTPPVCSYENSDYQTSFWDKGGREYEDAAEAVALRRLLPICGEHLLELGSGAGRNTPRYTCYNKVTLLDYSRTQLEQARKRLGENPAYQYVAADIYHLPFNDGVFDGATMIRTLHHMADPRAALAQVSRVLLGGSTFILEFANKRNLKAMLRYLMGRQSWSPYTLEPIEYLPLNFDFHPNAVRGWLQENHFKIERMLTVSHFRASWLKRHVPLKWLVGLDSFLQPTGSLVQWSPSIFVRSVSTAQAPAAQPGQIFQCPGCKAPLADTPPEIICLSCGRRYEVHDGIYDFRLTQS